MKYYLCEDGTTDFKHLIVHKPNPNNTKVLVEKCIWCNLMNEDICDDCKKWYDEIIDFKKATNMTFTELSEEEVFLRYLDQEPFKD